MARIETTSDAEQDLIEIYLYGIEHFGVNQAERYSEVLHARIDTIAENPSFGSDYGFVRDGLRRYESVAHAIYFQRIDGGVRVLRILHGRMDPGRQLRWGLTRQ